MTPTLVVQSYRTHDVPAYLTRCMASVQAWATASGFAYEHVDDALFDLLPPWFRDRCAGQLLPQTDVARLLLIRDRLRTTARVIWLDADVFFFAPQLVAMPPTGYAFCAESWLERLPDGGLVASRRVNNAAIVMDAADNPVLGFYLHACLDSAARRPVIGKLDFGPQMLLSIARVVPLPTLLSIGILSPAVAAEVARGGGPACAAYALACGAPIGAANLCASLVEDLAQIGRAMDVLEATGGDVINQHLRGPT